MKKLFTFMIMAVALGALSASAAYFAGERFNYPMGDVVTSSGGTWHYWQGNPPAPVVTNLYPYGSSSTNVTLDGSWQEGLWFFSNVFNSSTQAIVGFSFAAISSTNEEYYVYFCSGNAALQDSAYNGSGLGGFVINATKPATYTNVVSLHFWNSFGFYELSTSLPAAVPGNTPPWHDVRAVMYKTVTTGGYARIYVDGIYLGNVPFAMRDVDSLVTNALNTVDMYQTGAVDPDNRSRVLIDNIFLEDRANYTRYVAPTGNDASDGLTPATAYQTIAQATWQIPSGGNYNKSLIYVAPGVYANEYTIKSVTNNWKYGLYIRAGQVDRPNCYDVAVLGSGANNTIMYQDFSTVPGMTLLEQTMGFYIRDLRGWVIQDLQVQVTSNMPQDAWSWYYGTVGTFMGCRDSVFNRCLATMPLDWAKGKPGFHLNGGSGLTLQGCASVGGGMGFNVAGGPLAPLTIANNTFVGAAKGTAEGNSGVAMVFNGGSGTVSRCIVADAQRGGVLGGMGDVVHSVENDYYNCGTNATPGANTNYYDSGNILPNGDSYQQPAFATQDGFPYRAGLGNIGYKAVRGGVYYIDQNSPVAQDGGAFGNSWATAYRSVSFPVSQLNQGSAPALSDATYPVTFYLRGFFTNQFTASNGNPIVGRGLQYAGDYVSFIGESPTNTLIYKSSAFRNETGADGRNLTIYPVSKVSCTIRNMTLMTENWFPPGVNAYSLGAYRNWDTKSYLSNVYVHVLHCDTNTMVVSDNEAQVTAAISATGAPRLEAEDCLFSGGYNGFRANDGTLTQTFRRCTFRGIYSATGDALGGYGILLVGGGRNVMIDKCIIGASDKGAIFLGNTAVVMGNDNIVYGNGTTGVVNEGTGVDLLTNSKMINPLLGTYAGYPYASPYRATGYGWAYRPLEPLNSSWPMAGRNKQRQGWYTNGAPLTVAGILWTNVSAAAAGSMWDCGMKLGSTATDGQRVFAAVNPVAANNQATLLALDASTGTTIWNGVLGGAGRYCYGTPAVGETMVYIAEVSDGANQRVYGVDRFTGIPAWSNLIDNMLGAAMLLHDGKLYFDSDWNVSGLWCLDALSGTVLWSNRYTAGEWGSSGTPVSPDGSAVYNHGDDGVLHAIDANNGNTLWTAGPYEGGQGSFEPVVDTAGNIYCAFPGVTNGGPSSVLYKYAADGSNLWSFLFNSESDDGGMAFSPDGNTLYVTISSTSTNVGLFAIDTATGTEKWRVYAGKCGGSPVVAAPGNIIIGAFEQEGEIWARAIQDNGASATILWSISLGAQQGGWLAKSSLMRPAIMANGDVIVQNQAGKIACITVPEPTLLLGLLAGVALLLRKR